MANQKVALLAAQVSNQLSKIFIQGLSNQPKKPKDGKPMKKVRDGTS